MPEYTSLEKIRLQKIEELRTEGVEPYPTRAERTHTSVQAIAEFESAEKDGREVKATLAGRIRSDTCAWARFHSPTSKTAQAKFNFSCASTN